VHQPPLTFGNLGVRLGLGGQRLRRTGRQVTVEAGPGDARGFDDLGDGLIFLVAKVGGIGKLRWIDHAGPADPFAFSSSNGTGVSCAFDRVGSFHLAEERKHHDGQLRHGIRWIGGIDPDRVSQVPDSDAAGCKVVDEVQGVPDGTTQPVQGVLTMTSPSRAWSRASCSPGRFVVDPDFLST
jgi:hypothetical protein